MKSRKNVVSQGGLVHADAKYTKKWTSERRTNTKIKKGIDRKKEGVHKRMNGYIKIVKSKKLNRKKRQIKN